MSRWNCRESFNAGNIRGGPRWIPCYSSVFGLLVKSYCSASCVFWWLRGSLRSRSKQSADQPPQQLATNPCATRRLQWSDFDLLIPALLILIWYHKRGVRLDTAEAGAKRERQRQHRLRRAATPRHDPAPQVARDVSVTGAMGEWCPVHTEVLALAGRAIPPAPSPALARQQPSSKSVASRRHSLTPPGTFSTLRRHAR